MDLNFFMSLKFGKWNSNLENCLTQANVKKGQESSVVGRLGKGYPQIPQFQISPNYKHHIENLPIYPFKEEILETIEKVILNFLLPTPEI